MFKLFSALILFFCLALPFVTSASVSLQYIYDANGNLALGEGKYYEYDNANKLIRIRMGDKDGPVIAEYVYDHNGQRVKKTENGQTTYYIGKHFEEEFVGPNSGSTSYYFANNQRVARKAPDGNLFYFHSDHLGGSNGVTDAAGSLTERTRYYPYGDIREGGNERYTYTGKELDKASNSYYFEARQYSAGFRHFTQPDTIKPNLFNPQNLNLYSYVLNNPLKFIDPSGHHQKEHKDVVFDKSISISGDKLEANYLKKHIKDLDGKELRIKSEHYDLDNRLGFDSRDKAIDNYYSTALDLKKQSMILINEADNTLNPIKGLSKSLEAYFVYKESLKYLAYSIHVSQDKALRGDNDSTSSKQFKKLPEHEKNVRLSRNDSNTEYLLTQFKNTQDIDLDQIQ
ncbi:RHS repeat domain-containing protein [Desulfonema limicola]|nr:RHS repeat-associated core domain-containing protein [Desulfonema limicola]